MAQGYPRWQQVTLTILSGLYNEVRVQEGSEGLVHSQEHIGNLVTVVF